MRLFNRILATADGKRWLTEMLPAEPQVIVADNVASYYWQGTDQEYWDLEVDFANIAPPFQHCIIDWRAPSRIVSKETGTRPWEPAMPHEFTCTIQGIDLHQDTKGFPQWILTVMRQASTARWMLVCAVFQVGGIMGIDLTPAYSAVFFADEQGRPQKATDETWFIATVYSERLEAVIKDVARESKTDMRKAGIAIIRPSLDVVLLTLSFMHCKNVILEMVTPDVKLAKRTHARSGIALHRYHVLNIDPMRTVLRQAAQHDGLVRHGKALHICRGHFKDYRQRGLFGQHKGLFWWGQSVKGTAEHGTIEKLYAVESGDRHPAAGVRGA